MKISFTSLKRLFFFTPLNLISKEKAFIIWPVFTVFCAFMLPVFSNDIISDGASYTYAIGVLTPLIFDKLLAEVISKKSNHVEHFTELKFYYGISAIIIVLTSCFAYGSKIKTCVFIQFAVFCCASLIADLFYLCLHMSDFHDMI